MAVQLKESASLFLAAFHTILRLSGSGGAASHAWKARRRAATRLASEASLVAPWRKEGQRPVRFRCLRIRTNTTEARASRQGRAACEPRDLGPILGTRRSGPRPQVRCPALHESAASHACSTTASPPAVQRGARGAPPATCATASRRTPRTGGPTTAPLRLRLNLRTGMQTTPITSAEPQATTNPSTAFHHDPPAQNPRCVCGPLFPSRSLRISLTLSAPPSLR